MRPRTPLAMVAAAASLMVLSSCYGPVTTKGIDVTVHCVDHVLEIGDIDLGTRVIHVSLDTPEWSNPGADVPLGNATVTGIEASLTDGDIFGVLQTRTSGLATFTTVIEPPVFTATDGFAQVHASTAFGSADTTVTAPHGDSAVIRFVSVNYYFSDVSDIQSVISCEPLVTEPTLATILVSGDHNY